MTTRQETTLTQQTTKLVIAPVYHESGGRVTRTTARAYLVPVGRDLEPGDQACEHAHGHKTTKAAVDCGTRLWNGLPR